MGLRYFALADQFGSSDPCTDWPELSRTVVTFNMTAPMVAWMRFRGMAWRPTAEMAAVMLILALLILVAGRTGIVAMNTLRARWCTVRWVGGFRRGASAWRTSARRLR